MEKMREKPGQLRYWIWLQQVLGQGSPLAGEVLRCGLTPRQLYENRDRLDQLGAGLSPELCRALGKARTLTPVLLEKWREGLRRGEVRVLTPDSPGYPGLLRSLFSPPLVLYYWGDPGILEGALAITMVGPRKATRYGEEAAKRIACDLARCGVRVVSGHALGVDSAAQEGALAGGGKNVMVLACGHDWDYPKDTMGLRRRVVEHSGLVLGEYLPGSSPDGSHFPVRNRLLSGLSMGTVVVEAGETSGALITASHALEQGRDLFCVSSSIFSRNSVGIAKLIREGARSVSSARDILMEYLPLYPERIKEVPLPLYQEPLLFPGENPGQAQRQMESEQWDGGYSVTRGRKAEKKPAPGKAPGKGSPSPQRDLSFLPPGAKNLLERLEKGSAHVEELTQLAGEAGGEALALLTELEILGLVKSLPGGYYSLC